MTVPELCEFTHNYFDRGDNAISGTFAFEPDTMPEGVAKGQYFRVIGSVFNDGVHKAGDADLTTETFSGVVQPMRVPPAFVALALTITEYDKSIPAGGKYSSQSFNGWSGTLATGEGGLPATGIDRYRTEINRWRKL